MTELADVLAAACLAMLWLLAPLVLAAMAAGILAHVIGLFTGLQDSSSSMALRLLACGVTLWLWWPTCSTRVQAVTAELWSQMALVGRGASLLGP